MVRVDLQHTTTVVNPFQRVLSRHKDEVESALREFMPHPSRSPRRLTEAMRYSVFAGGKRLRGILVLSAGALCGGRKEDLRLLAAAVECVHAYSLIHDDLPCMDDDDFRRGKPTSHKKFGEAMAVLAGDALQTHAFELLAAIPNRRAIPVILEVLSAAIGGRGMVAGQVYDMQGNRNKPTLAKVKEIHLHKTAALLTACAKIGALAADADARELGALEEYGQSIGLAFQIVDDVLDIEGGSKALGKTAGKDRKQKKITFPAAVGIERSRKEAAKLAARAHDALTPFAYGADFLRHLANYIIQRDK